MNVPLETVIAMLTSDGLSTVEVFTKTAYDFSGIHVEPGVSVEFDQIISFRIVGPPIKAIAQ